MKRLTKLACAAAAGLALTGPQAFAMLVETAPMAITGTGLGAVSTSLTLQGSNGATFESAAVGVDPVTNLMTIAGDAKTGASQTRLWTLGDLGVTDASDLRVVFNAVEPGNASGITLDDLVLTVYGTDGAALFTSSPFSAVSFADTNTGAGRSGFVFALDAADQAAAAYAFAGNFALNRVGLSATASDFGGGPETFYLASAAPVSAVPEPATYWLMFLGLGAFIGLRGRRRAPE